MTAKCSRNHRPESERTIDEAHLLLNSQLSPLTSVLVSRHLERRSRDAQFPPALRAVSLCRPGLVVLRARGPEPHQRHTVTHGRRLAALHGRHARLEVLATGSDRCLELRQTRG